MYQAGAEEAVKTAAVVGASRVPALGMRAASMRVFLALIHIFAAILVIVAARDLPILAALGL